MEFCDFSKSGFLECKMPPVIHKTKYSSCFALEKDIYTFLFPANNSSLTFSKAKTNKTDLSGMDFFAKTEEFNCDKSDLTKEEVEEYEDKFNKLIKIHNWKKYAKDVNQIIDGKLKYTHSY